MKSRNEVAKKFFEQYKGVLVGYACKFPASMRNDLLQEAYLGIDHALSKSHFQDNLEATPFMKYVFPWAQHYMRDFAARNRSVVTASRRIDTMHNVPEDECEEESRGIAEIDPLHVLLAEEALQEELNHEKTRKRRT